MISKKKNGHIPDWSSPDDPTIFLAAEGRLKPSDMNRWNCFNSETKVGCWRRACILRLL